MKIIAINGSPRKKGNTETLLNSFLKGAMESGAEVESFRLADITFKNCKGCNACHKTGTCVITDDITFLFDKISHADVLILASPIYSMTVTAELKAFIDRGQFLWARLFKTKTHRFTDEYLASHKGIFLGTAGSDSQSIFDAAFPVVRAFFNDAGFKYTENLLFPGMDVKGGVKSCPEIVENAYLMGKKISFGK